MARSFSPAMILSAASAMIFVTLCLASRAQAEEYTKTYSVTGRAAVHVRVDDSSVRVVTADTHEVDFDVKHDGAAGLMVGGKQSLLTR